MKRMLTTLTVFILTALFIPNLFAWDGSGTPDTPYKISNRDDLERLAKEVNAGKNFSDVHFKLYRNINLEGKANPWTPIGKDYDNCFSGIFNGAGHVISNVYVTSTEFAGLFGYTKNATISHLGVVDVEIYGTAYAGGLIGYNDGRVYSCYAIGNVFALTNEDFISTLAGGLIAENHGSVNSCYATSTVTTATDFTAAVTIAGGLIAKNHGSVQNCCSIGKVSAWAKENKASAYAGGLIGLNNFGSVSNCYATGAVSAIPNNEYSQARSGGLIGHNVGGSVSNCYATGEVTANGKYANAYAGGLIGENDCSVSNCYATGAVSATASEAYAGGLIGENDGSVKNCYYDKDTTGLEAGEGEPKTTKEMTDSAFVDSLNGNPSSGAWKVLTDSYPRLSWEKVSNPEIKSGSYFFTQNGGEKLPHDGLSEETAFSFAELLTLSESGKLTADSYTFIFKSGEYENFALNMPSVKNLYIIFEAGATVGTNGGDPMLELPNAQYVEITGLKLFGVYMTTDRPLILNAPNAGVTLKNADIENNRFAHAPKLINARNAKVQNCKINNNTR